VPVDQTCAEKWPRNGAFSLWSLGPNLRWCRQRPCFWWHVFLQPCRALRFLLCKFVLPCFWTKSTTQRLLGTRHVGISWYCPLAGHMCHGFSTCYGLGIWSWSHHGTQSMGDDHPAIHPQMISNSVGNVGVSISQWLRDKAVTRQVNTHTHIYIYILYIYDYICICIRICGCVVYNIMWLYVSEWGHPPLYAQLLLGGNSRFFNSRSNPGWAPQPVHAGIESHRKTFEVTWVSQTDFKKNQKPWTSP
jgi:hypothetical protein